MIAFTSILGGLLMAQSAMIETPPSPAKRELIARFLELSGTRRGIDNGNPVEARAVQDGMAAMQANLSPDGAFHGELTKGPLGIVMEAYQRAYAKHRDRFERAYANHVNWEFTEEELREINAFLGSKTGQHYLEGEWRMRAYTRTNTEHLELRIAEDAKKMAKADLAAKGFKSAPALDLTYEQMKEAEGLSDE